MTTPKGRNGKRAGDREAIETRRRKVWELRLAGLSTYEIARQLSAQEGVSISAANVQKDIKHTLAELAKETRADAEAARDMMLARLAKMRTALWTKIRQGDERAIATALKIEEREAKLLGLDRPIGLDLTSDGQAISVVIKHIGEGNKPNA